MRLFLAIDVPEKAKKLIEGQIRNMQLEYPQFDWVPSDNYHITIHFFGEVDKIESLEKRLEEYLYDKESFYLYSYNAGLFMNHKIVIYLDFRREKKLELIAKEINEGKFIPHLTLARCKIPSKQQYFVLKKRLHKLNMNVSFQVKKLVLFHSILGQRTPVYKIVKQIPLL